MNISDESLRSCFSKLKLVNEIYGLHFLSFGNSLKSLDDLIEICNSFLDKNIVFKLHKQRFNNHPVRGFYFSLSDKYEVVLLDGQNQCWRRFVTCKEIFQVLLDEASQRSTDLNQLIDEVTLKFPDDDHLVTQVAETEVLAEICAAEFLFPHTDRERLLQVGENLDFDLIADQRKVPKLIVERYLSSGYMGVLNPASHI
jgi:Zn-dependent peptidase ImmA (M78 family)